MYYREKTGQESEFSSQYLSSRTTIDTAKNEEKLVIENSEMSRAAISRGKSLHLPAGMAQNLTEVLLKTAKQTSSKGVTYIQSDDTENFQSYLELKETAEKILTGLKQLGLKPKDKVILQLERNRDFIEAFWACILGGFVPVPLATAPIYEPDNSAAKKLHNAWQILDKPLVLTSEKLAVPIRNLAVQLQLENLKLATLNRLSSSTSNTDYYSAKPDDIALMLLTSGSTGVPKTVKLSHQNIIHSIAATSQMGEFTSQDISLNWLPLDHPGPLIRCVIRMVYLGCQQLHAPTAMVLQEPLKWLDWLDRYRVTITWAPNFAFALLNDRAEEIKQRHWDLTAVKSWLNTAEPIVPHTAMKLWELLNHYGLKKTAMHSSWGMAETSSGITHSDRYLSDSASDPALSEGVSFRATQGAREHASVNQDNFAELGLPVPGVALRIVDEQEQIVSEQTIGYLQVKGATVTSGYEQNPEANREAFTADGWFKTGDLGFLDRGRLTITGRIKDVIIINGNNCYSHEIEGVVEEIAGVEVSYTAACGIRQLNSNTDRLAIFFHTTILEDEALLGLLKKIQQQIVRKIGISPAYLIPVEPEAIPKTSIGKIQRSQLKQRFEAGEFDSIVNRIENLRGAARSKVERVAPQTELERQLASIWQEVLEVPAIGINDDFFELGGHSILVFQIISRLREELKIELPIQYLFQASTIGELSKSIERGDLPKATDTQTTTIPVRGQAQAPLSYMQQGVWFLDRLEGQNATYNIPLVLRLTGNLDHDCLQKAIATVIERHETLRTRFITVDGIGRQEIVPAAAIDLNLIDLRKFAPGNRDLRVIQLAKEEAGLSFDLTQAPLVRAKLLYLEDNSHVLLLTVHHIVADGWSMNVLIEEIWTIYRGLVAQTKAELEPLPIQYADFALWQREHYNDATLAPQLEYWQDRLAGIPPTLELPLDRPRPAKQTFAGSSKSFQLSQEVTEKLQALSQRSGTTLYMTVLATFGVLMHRYSRQSDIVIGSPIANRKYHEVESLIGFFVNTLALRLDLANQPSFNALLQQVRQVTLDAYAHQDVPFRKVVEQLELDRDLSHHPIFQVMFTWQNMPDYHEKLGDLSVKQVRTESVVSKFDLAVYITASAGELQGSLTYKTDLFDEATIDRLLNNWKILLQAIADAPETPINRLPLLTTVEQQQLVEWNQTQTDTHLDRCIDRLFAQQVELTPNAVAVVAQKQQLTYRELNDRANQLAHYLQDLSVKPDELVAICLPRTVDALVSILGVLKAGAAYLFIDPKFPTSSIDFRLQDAGARVLVTNEAIASQHSELPIEHQICLDRDANHLATLSTANPTNAANAANLVYAIYTSGSTGKPKGVAVEHRQLVNYVEGVTTKLDLTKANTFATVSTFAADLGNTVVFPALCTGGCLHIIAEECLSNANSFAAYCRQHPIDCLKIVPSHLETLLDVAETNDFLPQSHLILGGEASNWQLVHKIQQINPKCKIFNHYGPTETTVGVLTYQASANNKDIAGATVPLGKPLPNTQVYVLDADLQPVPLGVPGELHIGGAGLARGYLNRSDLTATKFITGNFADNLNLRLYKTGDLVRYRSDGNLEFLGRIDNQVKLRGFRIELGEIEAVLARHPSIREKAVLVRQDRSGDKRLVAYIVAQPESPRSSDLRSFLQECLPDYMVPSAFVFLDTMPLTPNGKVDRRALPAPDTLDIKTDVEYVPPSNPTEELLATIWADILDIERIGVNDNFFESGGHSLLATRVISRCCQAFSVEISLQLLFEKPTIATLARAITQYQQESDLSKYQTISPREKSDSTGLSFAQKRLWFLDRLEPNSSFYNMPRAVILNGELNLEVLQQALDAIVVHHEIIRTNYTSANGNAIQVIAAPQAVELSIFDLQQYEQTERETQVQKRLQQESQRPFNLESDIMLRGCLLKLAPQEHVLLLVMHHIASDGWSMGILWSQLTQLYQAFLNGRSNPLKELPIQYADYAVWQREWLSGEVLDRQLSYWQQQLADAKPLLELPTDRPRPAVQTYRGARQSFILSKNTSDRLKQLCRQSGVTLYMSLLAAFQTLLYRYSRQEDILVGSPIAGRNRAEIEDLIGFFVNTLVLRTDLSGNPSFQELLTRVRSVTSDAYSHQDLPFEKLVEELNPERSLSYSPLFQVMFVLQNASKQAGQMLGLTEEPVQLELETAKFDLILSVTEKDGTLFGSWSYNTDLFNAATIERMTANFQTLLEGIVDNPQQPIAQLPLLSTNERQQLLVEWNDTYTEYPRDKCIHSLFEEQVERTPDAVAVVFEGQQLTYRELNHRANQLAHYLQKLGVKPNMLVGICTERSFEMVVGLLGILKAGGAYVPLDSKYPQERLNLMLSDSQINVLLTQEKLLTQIPKNRARLVCLDTHWQNISQEDGNSPISEAKANDLAYICYTSGSTGKPKGVSVPHRGVVRLVKETNYVNFSCEEVFLQLASISFDASTFEIWGSLLNGAKLVLMPAHAPSLEELGQVIQRYQVSTLWLTAGLFHLMVDKQIEDLKPVRQLLAGGDILSVSHVQKVLQELPDCRLINGYGPTENTTFSCCYTITEPTQNGKSIPIGKAIANTQAYILDTYLQPVPIGVPGELYVGGDGLAKGYLNRPELTAEKFVPNPFSDEQARLYKTGDLACYLADGNIEFLGRKDYQVKIRGFRIELSEIESVLAQHPGVQKTIAIAREDNSSDKRIVAYVVPQLEQPNSSELRSFLQERLPNYMMPSAFILLDTLPLTPNGKVDRRALPAPDASNIQLDTNFVPPSNPTEEALATIWIDILGVERVGIHDNFFELGGHSLLALLLFTKIEQEFGRTLSLATLFEAPTIKDLANIIDRKQSLAAESCLVPIQPKGSKPPLFLLHARGTSVLVYRDLVNHLGTERPVYGIQPQGLNGAAEILTTAKEMAAYYIQEIKKIQPIGPYLLGGYSFGGELAFEMSRQLHQQGEKVDKLILFDSNAPNSRKRSPFSQRIIIHLNNLLERKHNYVIERVFDWKRWLQDDLKYNSQKLTVKVFEKFNLPLSLRLHSILIEARNEAARKNQHLQFYPGKLTLMRTEGNFGGVGIKRNKYLGWQNLVGQEIDVYPVPGHHFSMFEEPHVRQLAAAVKSCLDTQADFKDS